MAKDDEYEYEDEGDRIVADIFKRLRKRKDVERIGKIFVDVPGAIRRRVACTEGLCMENGRGKQLSGKSCCTTYRVVVDPKDINRIAKVVDEVAQIRDVQKAIDKREGWWRVEDDEILLEDRPSGACVFLSAAKGERPWCTIHEWALNNDLEFRDYKPETCCLYPLYLLEWGDEVLVTSYGSKWFKEADPDEADDIKRFDCLHPPKGKGRSILVEQHDELRYRLGARRWDRVLSKLRKRGYSI